MRVICPDQITSLSATNEDASYPASNMQTDHLGEVFKATGVSSVLTVNIARGNALGLHGCNAETVEVTRVGGIQGAWATAGETDGAWATAGVTDGAWPTIETEELSPVIYREEDGSGGFFVSYDQANLSHTLTVALQTDESVLEAGAISAGVALSFPDPLHGSGEGIADYTVEHRTRSNSRLLVDGPTAREFNFTVRMLRETEWRTLVHQVYRVKKSYPLSWLLNDTIGTGYWVVWGFVRPGTLFATHDQPLHSNVRLEIEESI